MGMPNLDYSIRLNKNIDRVFQKRNNIKEDEAIYDVGTETSEIDV